MEELKPSKRLGQMSEVFNTLLSAHIIDLLNRYYENANVRDNPLELPEDLRVPYNSNHDIKITGIELFFDDGKEIMYFHLEDSGVGVSKYPLVILSLQMKLELLAAYEKFCGYTHQVEFNFPAEAVKPVSEAEFRERLKDWGKREYGL